MQQGKDLNSVVNFGTMFENEVNLKNRWRELNTLIGLILGFSMLFLIASCNDREDDKNSTEIPFTAPQNAFAVKADNGIRIEWDKVSGTYNGSNIYDALGYTIERSSDRFTFIPCGATDASQTYYVDTNPMQGNNYYRIKAKYNSNSNLYTDYSEIVLCHFVKKIDGGTESGLYMGIIGFNDALNVKTINMLNEGSRSEFHSFISNMKTKQGTVMYYAVDSAISMLQAATTPEELVNVSIVTFTDGLDQGSIMLNSNYPSKSTYLNAVHNRIVTTKIEGLNISAYSIGIRGKDVGNTAEFSDNLDKLASSPQNKYEVTTMDEVNNRFREIASSLYNETKIQTIKIKIPGQENGAKIRFTFDNVSNAANSTLYIEGTYNYSAKSLQNIVYQGLKSNSGTMVTGMAEGIFVIFSFVDLKTTAGDVVPLNDIKQWAYETSYWQINSEFSQSDNTNIIPEQKSAVIMLVLDCSTSLDNQFGSMQSSAKNFIDVLVGNIKPPVVATSQATNVTAASATLGGNISNVGAPAYTERGVCYSISQNPTISNNKLVASGSGTTGSFSVNASGLSTNTTYYVRAYATNSAGTAYGDQISFQTSHPLAAILGEYTATGTSFFDGTQAWTVTIAKDPAGDASKVWITNFVAGGSSTYTPLYGVVNTEKTELKIPVGQQIASSSSYNVKFVGCYGSTGAEIPAGGSVTCVIGADGIITVMDEIGSLAYSLTDGNPSGYYNYFLADVVMVKK